MALDVKMQEPSLGSPSVVCVKKWKEIKLAGGLYKITCKRNHEGDLTETGNAWFHFIVSEIRNYGTLWVHDWNNHVRQLSSF
jgi:formyltetrahydrofolate synthetase